MPDVEQVDQAFTGEGRTVRLTREGSRWFVRIERQVLMSSETHGSEEMLAALTCERLRERRAARILVGGLGMGFTLRAVLDLVATDAVVDVAELIDAVVAWNRGPLADLAGRPLDDPRVTVRHGDVAHLLEAEPFDVILLDIDNGPEGFTVRGNDALYELPGLRRLRASLRPGGALGVWSAFRDPRFERRLRDAGFVARTIPVRARGRVRKGAAHWIFVAVVPDTG